MFVKDRAKTESRDSAVEVAWEFKLMHYFFK